jgi:hypothetical protein
MAHRLGIVAGPNDRIHVAILHSLSQPDSATRRVRVQLPHSGLTTFPELGTWK